MKKTTLNFMAACYIALSFMSCEPANQPAETPFDVNGGMSTGVFTVAEGKTVQFSRGNLQYCPSTNKWRFAENQYTSLGTENTKLNEANFSGWIDLFSWGTGDKPTCTVTSPLTFDTFVDWGTNAIYSESKSAPNYWRTLSDDEWMYLLHQRKNAQSLRGQATLRTNERDVHGLVIWPDDSKVKKFNFNTQGTEWTDNEIEMDAWQVMQNYGAVFMPAAGYYEITSAYAKPAPDLRKWNEAGYYWSSTEGEGASGHILVAHEMSFAAYDVSSYDDTSGLDNTVMKNQGCAVRLAREK